MFVERLEQGGWGQILDLGPVCGDNINFFARHVRRLYLCDMFFRLVRKGNSDEPFHRVWEDIDYPPESFDGVLVWDLLDRVDDLQVGKLVKRCQSIVKPGGTVMIFALGEHASSTVVNSFVIKEDFRLYLRPQHHLNLPLHVRRNREVLKMMSSFTLLKSFIYRNGTREFLFRRPSNTWTGAE